MSNASDAGKKRGLGRGLSALMEDVGMDTILGEETPENIGDNRDVEAAPEEPASINTSNKKPGQKQKKTLRSKSEETASEIASETRSQSTPAPNKSITYVAMDQLTRNPDQPRRYFDNALLDELAESIRDKGVLQPVLVRTLPEGAKGDFSKDDYRGKQPAYQIIAGERRWQAALKAGLDTIPVFIREISDREALEIGVVENVHRADLNPMEEALAYKSLLTQFQRTQEDVAQAVGKSRPYVSNMLRLLNLPESVQTYLAEGKITTGHARAIIAAPNPQQVADAIVEHDLSVRDAENLVRRLKLDENAPVITKAVKAQKDADIRRVEEKLSDALGLVIDLRDKGGKGELRLKYKNGEQLEEVIKLLLHKRHEA